MVPMPGSAGNHQMVNAQAMAAEGRAQVVPQGPGLAPELAAAASLLMGEPARLAGLCRGEPNRAVQCCLDDLARLG
jgi:UDP-N-acetylglucosamine--N-acetylmuramyl-(pentapeptide) pyrophosphoryl-undecaprenol N-acetylglucosamine transferase